MGVFSWFRRKPAAASEPSTVEALTDAPTAKSGADEAPVEAEATTEKTATEKAGPAGSGTTEGDSEAGTAGDGAAEGVEIPKQQSSDAAADNEAGESTRK